ncbi:MAG TPA: DNA cytosine methyltransferase [Bryobacteraceae bacterium]
MELTAVESFCGAGGMAIGLKDAGFKSLLAFDLNEAAISTYRVGIGEEGEVMDARAIAGEKILKRIGLRKGELDLFAGGPPCQGFSLQRRRGYDSDERNDLVGDYFRLVEGIMPRAFLLENVVMLGKVRGKKYTKEGFSRLHELGYQITTGEVNCAYYGIAQTRRRFIAIGIRGQKAFHFPAHTHERKKWATVRGAIGDLPDCPEDFSEHAKHANHIRCRVTQRNLEMLPHVPQGGGWRDIPKRLWLDCMKRWDGKTSGGWPDVYGRLEWEGQCPTITAGFDSFSRGRYTHPKWDRAISPREAARLQTFPDTIRFLGTRHDVRLQIGNAVPPRLAFVFGEAIRKHLIGTTVNVAVAASSPKFSQYAPQAEQQTLFAD